MDRMTGEMVTRPAPPDRERQQQYVLTVTVEDDGTPPLSVRCGSRCFSGSLKALTEEQASLFRCQTPSLMVPAASAKASSLIYVQAFQSDLLSC